MIHLQRSFENELQTFKGANKCPLNHNYAFYNKHLLFAASVSAVRWADDGMFL